jgi:hypothetical protein
MMGNIPRQALALSLILNLIFLSFEFLLSKFPIFTKLSKSRKSKTKKVKFFEFEVQKITSLDSGRAENRSAKTRPEKPRFPRKNGASGGSRFRTKRKRPRNAPRYPLEKFKNAEKSRIISTRSRSRNRPERKKYRVNPTIGKPTPARFVCVFHRQMKPKNTKRILNNPFFNPLSSAYNGCFAVLHYSLAERSSLR